MSCSIDIAHTPEEMPTKIPKPHEIWVNAMQKDEHAKHRRTHSMRTYLFQYDMLAQRWLLQRVYFLYGFFLFFHVFVLFKPQKIRFHVSMATEAMAFSCTKRVGVNAAKSVVRWYCLPCWRWLPPMNFLVLLHTRLCTLDTRMRTAYR